MADATVKKIGDMEAVYGGALVRARASLGIKSFGMQVMNLPPNYEDYPLHDEQGTRQEEVYIPLKGSARLLVGDDEYELEPGVFARVGPAEKRRLVPGPDGVQILALGAVPGAAYEPAAWTELGQPTPSIET